MVDLDLGDMRAIGKGHPFPRPVVIGVERRALVAADRGGLDQPDPAVGAGHDEISVLEADVGLGRFQRLGGDAGALWR